MLHPTQIKVIFLEKLIVDHHSQESQMLESRLQYIATASSILHEMPWVEVKECKV